MTRPGRHHPDLVPATLPGDEFKETAWIEVIRKMDEVYSDLIGYEVELEEKNARLEEAQRFIASVLSSMSDVLIVCDSRGRVQEVNRAALDLTGRDEDDLIGRPLRELFDGGFSDAAGAVCRTGTGAVLRDMELRMIGRDNRPTEAVAVNCTPRLDHEGRSAGMVLIGRPVGELRRAYEALNQTHQSLQQAQKQIIQSEKMASLGRLVAGVAHELNNPISFIYGNLHMLGRYRERLTDYFKTVEGGVAPKEAARIRAELRVDKILADLPSLIDGTIEGAERVADIVKSLRRLSFGGESGHERLDLTAVVNRAAQWAVKGKKAGLHLVIDLPAPIEVMGNAGQLHQVVVNLVDNAIDAAADRPNPQLSVHAAVEGAEVRVWFRDNGPGIDPDGILRVFDPFFTTKEVGHGTGLGLWISYDIVKSHGGGLDAANHPDGGAVFALTLPLAGGE